jgi:hypothetical protein
MIHPRESVHRWFTIRMEMPCTFHTAFTNEPAFDLSNQKEDGAFTLQNLLPKRTTRKHTMKLRYYPNLTVLLLGLRIATAEPSIPVPHSPFLPP